MKKSVKQPKKRKLTPKQKMFVKEYLVDLCATAAARRAGYSDPSIGRQLITKNHVAEYIKTQKDKRANRLEISADRVLQERARLAYYNVKDLYNPDGTLKKLHELDDNLSAAIHGVTIGAIFAPKDPESEDPPEVETYIRKVKMPDKDKSLTALEKHLGIYEKDNEQKGNADLKTKQEFMEALLESISKSDRGLPKN